MGNPGIHGFKRALVVYLCVSCALLPAAVPPTGEIPELMRLQEGKDGVNRGSVYVYGDQNLDSLVPVRVIGSVGKAGLHYVPQGLDLFTLVSVAGGTLPDADIENVTINRTVEGKKQVLLADMGQLVKSVDASPPTILANDTIFVPQEKAIISDNVVKTVGILVGLATVAVSIVAISRR